MTQVKDITSIADNLIAVTFEAGNGRDVVLFQDRADEQALNELKVS